MGRKTHNFIQAYTEQHNNGYVPVRFYIWTAISTIAAALERRVWLPWHHGNIYPNMYIFLVSGPSSGKSSAIRPGIKLLKKSNEKHHSLIRLLPNQTTEAQLLDILGETNFFTYRNKQYQHSSAYLVASEASACFKNSEEHGIVKALTALYDPDDFKKETVSRAEAVNIINPCVNVIAGTTFYDLNAFLHKQGILGGFASRCTFVVERVINKKATGWYEEEDHKSVKDEISAKLIHDLGLITKMTGSFKATEEVKEAWLKWEKEYHAQWAAQENEILKAFMSRKMLAIQKLVQILCAADSDDMIITRSHWDHAKMLVDEVEKDIPKMLREGQATNTGTSEGIKAAVISELEKNPRTYTRQSLLAKMTLMGHDGTRAGITINTLINDPNTIKKDGPWLSLAINPDLHT